jgi:apolipoprotein D and lipocalin family protein
MKRLLLLTLTLLTGCASLPKNVTPVDDFNVERYLGVWYEIARLDHSFERGLSQVTAQYSWRNDGGIEVINRGYLQEKGMWKEAKGKAYLAGEADQGFLRVSFFGPFYGAYVVCALDRNHYRYALVCGPDTSYLWILARTPTLDEETISTLVAQAEALGYNTRDLIYVNHQPMENRP